MKHSAVINNISPLIIPPISFQLDSGSSHTLMVDDRPKSINDRPDTLIMKTASKQNISSNTVAGLTLESLPTIPVHKFFSKDLAENLLSVHDLTFRGYEVLFSGSSAKVLKDQKIVALYPKA